MKLITGDFMAKVDFIEDVQTHFENWANSFDQAVFDSLLAFIFVIFIWIIFGLILRKLKGGISPNTYNALKTLGRATILLLGILWVVGDELFLGAAALMGTAIGFASTTTLGNFMSGLYLLLTNPFSIGDYIIIPSMKIEGIVEELSINYTKILTPQGIHVIVSNQKMLGTSIQNTMIEVPVPAVKKGKITWKDDENDKFDSIEDVVDIFKGFRTQFADKIEKYYLYPLKYNINPDKYAHSKTSEVLNETIQRFSDRCADKIEWLLLSRSDYQLNLIVSNPYAIFDLKSDIIGYIEDRIEQIHQ